MRRVAVVLNRNARRVSPSLVRWMSERVEARDLFVTGSPEDGRAAARQILDGDYGAVCVGGGDGTFMQVAGDLLALGPPALPALLPLRLGTGNAICDVCETSDGSRAGLLDDLAHAAGGDPPADLRLLRVAGRTAHFSGVGLDAQYAEDHRALVKERLLRGPFAFAFRGVVGHSLAAALRTLPRLARSGPLRVRVVNGGGIARRLDANGSPVGAPIAPGELLHDGPVTIAAASTVPYYSSRLRFFPHADAARAVDGGFHLRVSTARPAEIVRHLPGIFDGTYHNPATVFDFAVTAIDIESDEPMPCHAGGDVLDRTTRLHIALADRGVPLLRRSKSG